MSLVRVAVPVLHGRRRFHFDKGRPWTILEHIILASLVMAKPMDALELSKKGNVPQQIVVEALIRLMRAGWVQMLQDSGRISFEPTSAGTAVATLSELPSIPRRLSRNMNFVIDQVTGTVYRNRQLPFLHAWMVQAREAKEPIAWIDAPAEQKIEEIRPLVDALFQDDEKFVAVDPNGSRLMERWALITVRDGNPERLPPHAPAALRAAIVDAAEHARPREIGGPRIAVILPEQANRRAVSLPPEREVSLSSADLIVGGPEHLEALKSVLRRARHRIFIHSTFVGKDQFAALEADLKAALNRGARIDIFWGQDVTTEGVRSTRLVVGALRQRLAAEGATRLVIHPFSTQSHSKLLVADEGSPEKMTAWVGTCNWLYSNFRNLEVSVKLRDPSLVIDVLDQLAELSRGTNDHWTDLTSEIVAIAANLERSRPIHTSKATAGIVFGRRHAELMRVARDECRRRLFVASHRLSSVIGPAVLEPVGAAAKAKAIDVKLYYDTQTTTGDGADAVLAECRQAGLELVQCERMHAKILAWDDDAAVITSQNWLSSDPSDDSPRQEIGVYLRAPGIAKTLIDRFQAAMSEYSP